MAKNKLSFIVIGNNHADFTPFSVLIRLFEQLSKRKIPCAFKEEGPSDVTLAGTAASTEESIQQTRLIKKLFPTIQKLYIKDKASNRSYLKKSAWEPIKRELDAQFMPLLPEKTRNEGVLNCAVLEVFRENAHLEELKLYKKLEQLQIHFAGIEADTATYTQYMIASNSGSDEYSHNELMRINYMVKNIMSDALTRFPEGGIVFIYTGRNHAHRLAANLLHYAKTQHLDLSDYDFHTFRLSSSYVREFNEDNDDAIKFTASLDSTDIQEIYKSMPCPIIHCKEKGDFFSFPELESLVLKLIQDFEVVRAPSKTLFSPLSPHDQLVVEIKKYISENPRTVSDKFIGHIETSRNYSSALRNACSWGNGALVKLFIKFSDTLPIDFNQTSSNGKTPLTWFEDSKAEPAEKIEITALLKEKMSDKKPAATQLI